MLAVPLLQISLSLSPTLPSSNNTPSLQSENVRCHRYESSEVIVNTALLLHIEMLESKNVKSRKQVEDLASRRKAFRFEMINLSGSHMVHFIGCA